MNWRPEGWNESAEVTAKQCAEDEKFKASNLEHIIRGMFEAGADCMLMKVCSEIEKVGLSDEEIEQVVRQRFPVFEMNEGDEEERDASAREICQAQLQKILTLLKK